jgi:mannose/cellobiose epimerase-like protein (N-acyl-D-glucosamine 2-epimerase family)
MIPTETWLRAEQGRLLRFAENAVTEDGFGWLDATGEPEPGRPTATWITARMTHVFSLAHRTGDPHAGKLADHGLAALTGPLHDERHGGWFAATDDPTKDAYQHAFVVLAASSAAAANRPGADGLLHRALTVVEDHFWDDHSGMSLESWDRAWLRTEDYRGANSNMHLVEAFLAAADVTGDTVWRERALRIAERLIHRVAAAHDWRLPEHFTPDWTPLPEYNVDDKAHQFRPYGGTVGHWLEWSRLLVQLHAAGSPRWLLDDATALFDSAVRRGWHADGTDGFVYTVDWQDRPVVRERMHWVMAEAILAADALHRQTGEPRYAEHYRNWWDYVARHHLDTEHGSWHHELDPCGRPSHTVWPGKPDVYHAYQAVLLPLLPLAPTAAKALDPIM